MAALKFKVGDKVDWTEATWSSQSDYKKGKIVSVDKEFGTYDVKFPSGTELTLEDDELQKSDTTTKKNPPKPQSNKKTTTAKKSPAKKSPQHSFALGDKVEKNDGDIGTVVKVNEKNQEVLVKFSYGQMWIPMYSKNYLNVTKEYPPDNATKDKPLGKVVFGGRGNEPEIAKLQKAKPGSETDTPLEGDIYSALRHWVGDANKDSADTLQKRVPAMANKYPQIFQPSTPDKTPLFRGLKRFAPDTKKALLSTKITDWVPFEKGNWWLCKKPIEYKPHLAAQSWTHDLKSAKNFGDFAILITRQKKGEFFMNTKVMKILFGSDEKEVLHLGKTYTNKVYVAVSHWEFKEEIEPKINRGPKAAGTFKSFAKAMKENNKNQNNV